MRCLHCGYADSRVLDSRTTDDGMAIRRRRSCPRCGDRFTTLETAALMVAKRSGVIEPFSREKLIGGVRKACHGRPVSEDSLAVLGQLVEKAIRAIGRATVSAHDVGLATLEPLRELDEVAYLRFASVYMNFSSLTDFEDEIARLRALRSRASGGVEVPSTAAAVEPSASPDPSLRNSGVDTFPRTPSGL